LPRLLPSLRCLINIITDDAIKGSNPMTPKNLQIDSKFNQFDTDGDGVVTDEELSRSERMLQIENNDKMQDQQRLMAWVAMWSYYCRVVFALLSPLDCNRAG
jgi:hypothetical protein